MQVAVGIDVNHPRLSVLGETKVHPSVVPASQCVEGRQRRVDHPRLQLSGQGAGDGGAVNALG